MREIQLNFPSSDLRLLHHGLPPHVAYQREETTITGRAMDDAEMTPSR
jgi:hypothetical protein